MPKTIRVNVTEEDIKNGEQDNPFKCPVAIALRRAIGDRCEVSVEHDYMGIAMSRYSVPEVCRFVSDFDCGDPVKPFSFTLEKP